MTPPAGSSGDTQTSAPASYREYTPSEKLRPFVECLWTRDSVVVREPTGEGPAIQPIQPIQPVHRVLPDGCIDVVLGFSGQADEPESAMAVGTMTRALVLDAASSPECFVGVRFRPGKASAFLTVPANELTDLRVPLDELWLDAAEVRDTLAVSADAMERVRALERVLAARVSPHEVAAHHDVDEAIRRIVEAGGSLGITRLAPALGVTRQHLARRFSQLVGVSPKTFARVVRLGRVIERARAVPAGEALNWSAVALELGYYDQAHLVDEFRELTGVTPTAWHRR
jgi:AraC-like DNA-binding protein